MKQDESVATRIMNLRKDKGYSREKLAGLADISPGFLYEIEADKKGLSAITLMQLASALEVSSDYLLYGSNHSNFKSEIAAMIDKFEPNYLGQVQRLLQLTYEITHEL